MIYDPFQFFCIFLPSIFFIVLSESTKSGNLHSQLSLFILLDAFFRVFLIIIRHFLRQPERPKVGFSDG